MLSITLRFLCWCSKTSTKSAQTRISTRSVSSTQRHSIVATVRWPRNIYHRRSGHRRQQRRGWSEKNNANTTGGPSDGGRASHQRRRLGSPGGVGLGLCTCQEEGVGTGSIRVYDPLGSQDVQRWRQAATLRRSWHLLQQHGLVTQPQGTCRSVWRPPLSGQPVTSLPKNSWIHFV